MPTVSDRRLRLAALCAVFLICIVNSALARWKPEYAALDADERAWYSRQQTTPETRARLNASWYNYCCSHADTVEAEFCRRAGKWFYRTVDDGDWHALPDDVVQLDVMTPHGKPVLFIDQTRLHAGPVCFFPGAAGT